ncbi:hydroxymethylglutaryl-CoA synthase family protein [Sneathiella sp.]|uniref:hydroxymethylglutaryl-CoA synthase family protein n=1 Tax=Sneathiella sp. TaxID=1964365 RepID=UPI003567D720
MIGLTGFGGYIPRLRLSRKSIADTNGWIQPGLKGLGKGERSICNWDEDSVTMAVEAARDCLHDRDNAEIRAIYLGSTTLPFLDRQNSGIVAAALNMDESLSTVDITSSQKAGTTALSTALDSADSSDGKEILVLASDARHTRAAAQQEMIFGDGAAAFTVGSKGVIAESLARHSFATDFVDHYRGENRSYDYNWEERWIRDEGYLKIMPQAIDKALAKAGIDAASVDTLIAPSTLKRVPEKIAQMTGINADALADALDGRVGATGCAHPLVMLSHVLESAKPGQIIVVASFGQGCDVLIFKVTNAIADRQPQTGISGYIARRQEETNYNKYMAFNDLVEQEKGMRAELDNQTAMTQLYRRRDMLLGLVGGECDVCGTRQFPRSRVCVNPNCNATNTQKPCNFSDTPAKIMTWSADHLTYCPDPPLHYGMIQFEGGGRFLANFTDADVGHVGTGQDVKMMFRVKDFDNQRGFRRYFWKAAPIRTSEESKNG